MKLNKLQRLVSDYKKLNERRIRTRMDNCLLLLERFENSEARNRKIERRHTAVDNMEKLLSRFSKRGIDKLINSFNPLDILIKNYLPNEDDHSDLFAALLNPNVKHGHSILGIETLLYQVESKYGENVKVKNIKKRLKGKRDKDIFVETRKHDLRSAIDIKIFSNDFVIGIENKKSYGRENHTFNGPQTINQLNDLFDMQRPKENTLFIYIHPLCKKPRCRNYIMMDKYDVCEFYKIIAAKTKNRRYSAFLSFYSEYYLNNI